MADASGLPDTTWGCLPPGWIGFFAANAAPSGFLICNGTPNLSRVTYARLFGAVGTRYGAGDGATTFGIPDLRDKVAWGSITVGNYLNAGLPNITGYMGHVRSKAISPGQDNPNNPSTGALEWKDEFNPNYYAVALEANTLCGDGISLNAHNSNPIYGNSVTVQPPALTLLPCIKY